MALRKQLIYSPSTWYCLQAVLERCQFGWLWEVTEWRLFSEASY
jgi:hypothetical protein